ncbi:MAG TPA: tetratricopeptide repeat protein [Terriglobia bacterium]|nr:tetratricopeptide repeat protein [Terriglobia bacterium]
MKSLKIEIFGIILSVLVVGANGWTLGRPAPSPCPARPTIANDLDAGKYVEVASALRQEVAKNPGDAQATLWLARSFLDLGDYDQAVTFAERAVDLSPDCSESHFWLARSYGMKADTSRSFWLARKARVEYQNAVQLDPENLAARRDLMEFYLEAPWILGGSKDKAWEQLQAIASRDTTEGNLARGIYWRDLDKPELAAKEYHKVLEARPQETDAYFQIADFYEADEKPEQIEAAVSAVSTIAPNDPRLDYYSAVANVMKRRDLPKAEQDLKTYLARTPRRDDFPAHAAAYDWLGQIYEIWGKKQQAIEQYRSALSLSPDNQSARGALKRLDSN